MTPETPPAKPDFAHVESWVFDLDNTLYCPSANLFAQIDARMRAFITKSLGVDGEAAYALQKKYYQEHGTTLSGLMAVHGIDPHPFLDFVHDIDVSVIPENPALAEALERLPGRRLVFTNGTVAHAARVLERIGIHGHVEDIFDIVHADFVPKPKVQTFERFLARTGVDPHRAAMFEDLDRNLEPAAALGMTTVLVRPLTGHGDPAVRGWSEPAPDAPHIHYRTHDLAGFLASLQLQETA